MILYLADEPAVARGLAGLDITHHEPLGNPRAGFLRVTAFIKDVFGVLIQHPNNFTPEILGAQLLNVCVPVVPSDSGLHIQYPRCDVPAMESLPHGMTNSFV
jgi:hypothetical protein